MGWPATTYQTGLDELDVLEVLVPLQVAALMGGAFAEVRHAERHAGQVWTATARSPPRATRSRCRPREPVGHGARNARAVAGIRGLQVADLPYDAARLDVDHDALPGLPARAPARAGGLGRG
ncbi:hypothetical protein GCM10017559_77470 [Streptosporangium longisporum]|uniref:Uncharacterized protein n=1 Tax=Streptosporangium longisporum TaxID=46187 RepID=A0ABP6LFX3_9ACTN